MVGGTRSLVPGVPKSRCFFLSVQDLYLYVRIWYISATMVVYSYDLRMDGG